MTGQPTVQGAAATKPGFPRHRRDQPCGTTSALARWPCPTLERYLPTSLGSTVITRFIATTDALTPAGPLVVPCRGSLIHLIQTSDHAVSNHLRFSTSRVPLPLRWQLYCVRASPFPSRLAKTADRIEFTVEPVLGSGVTAWSFTSRCSPPGGMAPMQLRSVTGPTVSARSGTCTLLSRSALRRTRARSLTGPHTSNTVIWECGALSERALPPRSVHVR